MTGFCSLDEAQVLTKDGFHRIWQQKVGTGMTQTAAYDDTENLHRRISATHSSMYSGIDTFKRVHYRAKSRQRQQGARQGGGMKTEKPGV